MCGHANVAPGRPADVEKFVRERMLRARKERPSNEKPHLYNHKMVLRKQMA